MNIFRIPLNIFVVLLLLKIKYLSPAVVFQVCTVAHFVSFVSYGYFYLHYGPKSDAKPGIQRYGRQTSELEMFQRELES